MRITTAASTTYLLLLPCVASFSLLAPTTTSTMTRRTQMIPGHCHSSSGLHMAGFGGSSSSGGGMKKKQKQKKGTDQVLKLKPKSQWDKYKILKKESRVKVAARSVKSDGTAGEWFDVGQIKSEGNEFTELAVVVQRGMIVEHAKRLFPLQFLPKDQVEWAYADSDGDGDNCTWVAVDKSVTSGAPAGIEKKIGFEGNPDATGYYSRVVKQFAGDTASVTLAAGSNAPDRSVLPRVK